MKRISVDTLSTALQLPSQTKSSGRKSNYASETEINAQETPTSNHNKTEKPATFGFAKLLFSQCFPSSYVSKKQDKTYRKLKYLSLDKKSSKKLQKTEDERKTLSLKDSYLSFGKERLSKECNDQTLKIVNQCTIADMVGSNKVQKCNVLNMVKNTGNNSVMISTMNSINGGNEKYPNFFSSKLFLSQEYKIPNIISPVEPIKNVQPQKMNSSEKKISNPYEKVDRARRLSTDDSIKFKDIEEANQSNAIKNPLEMGSIICESIHLNQQNIQKPNFFEFDHMKDSLIDKLNLFRREDSFIESKKKSFIRSKKTTAEQSPRFCVFNPSFKKSNSKNHQNEQEVAQIENVDSKQTIEQKIVRKKFKTLDECGYTIVSKYNKSSQQKSVLQESNIVFQASKMCVDPFEQNINLPTFSDSQVVFNNEIKENYESQKNYNSFIHELNLDDRSDVKSQSGNLINKKVNRAFLRSKKSSSEKEIKTKDKNEMQIRFDLDTFIEYGPL